MNNKFFATIAILFLCKSFALTAGDVQSKDQIAQGHFVWCAGAGHLDGLQIYLKKGIDVNGKNDHGSTALMNAVHYRKDEAIDLLLAHGACVNQTDSYGGSVIYLFLNEAAPEKLNVDTLRLLLRNSTCVAPTQGLTVQTPEEILASLRAESCGMRKLKGRNFIRKKADFFAENIEAVEDERRATVAEVVLMSRRIFPQQSVINGTILSYVSPYKETLEERARTLAHLPKQH